MSAADKREELEAAAWHASGPYPDIDLIVAVLRAADAYAAAVADERIAGRVHDRTIGRERLDALAQSVAEVRGRS